MAIRVYSHPLRTGFRYITNPRTGKIIGRKAQT